MIEQFVFYNPITDKLVVLSVIITGDKRNIISLLKKLLNNYKYIGEL